MQRRYLPDKYKSGVPPKDEPGEMVAGSIPLPFPQSSLSAALRRALYLSF
jgi:hypothetical protein